MTWTTVFQAYKRRIGYSLVNHSVLFLDKPDGTHIFTISCSGKKFGCDQDYEHYLFKVMPKHSMFCDAYIIHSC